MIAQIHNERAREVEIHVLVWCGDLHYDIQSGYVSFKFVKTIYLAAHEGLAQFNHRYYTS